MIDAITKSSLTGNAPSLSAHEAAENNSQLKMDDFLQLLTSQITNQDPLEPMKDTEFISQMANIASLEQMQQFSKGFESFATAQKDMVAQAYLGREVQIDDEGTTIEGLVDSVEKDENGMVSVIVGGKSYDPQKITRVSLASGN